MMKIMTITLLNCHNSWLMLIKSNTGNYGIRVVTWAAFQILKQLFILNLQRTSMIKSFQKLDQKVQILQKYLNLKILWLKDLHTIWTGISKKLSRVIKSLRKRMNSKKMMNSGIWWLKKGLPIIIWHRWRGSSSK